VASILDFFSAEAGQNRTKALRRKTGGLIGKLSGAANSLLGPTGIPGKVSSAGKIASMINPVAGMERSMRAAGNNKFGESLIEIGGVVLPAGIVAKYGAKTALAAAKGLQESLTATGGALSGAASNVANIRQGASGVNKSTTSIADMRRQANIDRFGYDPHAPRTVVNTDYRGSHQPRGPESEYPVRLDDVTKSVTGGSGGYPSDFYGRDGSRLYAQGPRFANDEYGRANRESYRIIQKMRGNPDAEVTIYRAVPNENNISSINKGDFVTLSPKYAELHGSSGYGQRGNDAGKVISKKVKVRDVYFDGNDVNEFGYFPQDY